MTTPPAATPHERPATHGKPSGGFFARLTERQSWPWLKRGVTLMFFVLVGWLLFNQAREIEWADVAAALQKYSLGAAVLALALTAASFVLYSCFDLLSRRYTGHQLATSTVMMVTFICYAFGLNLGSFIGGIGFRYRLYSRLGLEPGTITRIATFSMLTNWMGYVLLAGTVFAIFPPALPEAWPVTTGHLRAIGVLLVGLAVSYLALGAFSRRREFHIWGHDIGLPSAMMAALQVTLGVSNWLLMSGIIFVLLQQRIEFSAVVSVLLLAAIAGVITHIPAGLGVLEAVFVALLSHRMPQADLIAALVAYRVVYYLVPLAVAAVIYLITESRAKKLSQSSTASSPSSSSTAREGR